MKLLKKVSYCLVFAFIIFCGFTLNVKAKSTEYRKCVYQSSVKTERQVYFLYRNNTIYIVGASSYPSYNAVGIFYNKALETTLVKEAGLSEIIPSLPDSGCPGTITAPTIEVRSDQTLEQYLDPQEYRLISEESEPYTLDDLDCTYYIKSPSNWDKAPDNFPGYKDQGGDFHYSPIEIIFDAGNLLDTRYIDYTSTAVSAVGYKGLQTTYIMNTETKNPWDFGSLMDIGGHYAVFKTLKDHLLSKQCPSYFYYLPDKGAYFSDAEIARGGKINFASSGTADDKYAIYSNVPSGESCSFVSQQLQIYMDQIADIASAIPKDGNLTQERKNEIESRLLSYDNFYQDMGASASSCGFVEEYEKFGEAISDAATALTESVQNSPNFTEEEKLDIQQVLNDFQTRINNIKNNFQLSIAGDFTCDSLLGDPGDPNSLYSLINTLFRYIQIIAPILLIVFGGVDFGKAVLSSDQEELKKAQARFVKRCIAAIVLFFLPYMIRWLMEQIMAHTGITDLDACMPK